MVLAVVAFAAADALGQQATAMTSVDLTVNGQVSLSTSRDLNFGVVTQGVTLVNVDPITGGNSAAFFTFSSSPHTPIIVTFSSTLLTSGSNDINFSGKMAGNSTSSQIQASPLSTGSALTTNSQGEYYFWIGGSARLSPNQPLGVYGGDFTLSIAY